MDMRLLKKLRWDRLGMLLGGAALLVFALGSFVSAEEEASGQTQAVILAHPGGAEPIAQQRAATPRDLDEDAPEEPALAPVKRDPRTSSKETVLPCACNKRVIPLPRNPYTAHRDAARALPNSFFVKDEIELRAGKSRGNLVDVGDGRGYHLAPMRHSHMMLLPETRDLLVDIGHAFADRLEGTPSEGTRLRITSLTRTDDQQRQLSRRNYNAINQSTHSYGASFDVAFMDRPDNSANCSLPTRAAQEVLAAFQNDGRILVIPEGNCFHITLRRASF